MRGKDVGAMEFENRAVEEMSHSVEQLKDTDWAHRNTTTTFDGKAMVMGQG